MIEPKVWRRFSECGNPYEHVTELSPISWFNAPGCERQAGRLSGQYQFRSSGVISFKHDQQGAPCSNGSKAACNRGLLTAWGNSRVWLASSQPTKSLSQE